MQCCNTSNHSVVLAPGVGIYIAHSESKYKRLLKLVSQGFPLGD